MNGVTTPTGASMTHSKAGLESRRRHPWLKRLTVINTAILVAVYLVETYVAERHWITTAVTYAPQIIYLFPLCVLTSWALQKRELRLAAANAGVGLVTLVALLGLNIPVQVRADRSGEELRVMTYNVRHGDKGVPAICEVIEAQNPDVLCLQEVAAQRNWQDPGPEIQRSLQGWQVARGGALMIATRHTIESSTLHEDADNGSFDVLEAVVDIRGTRVTVLTTHLGNISPLGLVKRKHGRLGTGYVREQMETRARQMDYLLQRSRDINGPLVVAGDFNTPPAGLLYKKAVSQMQDSFKSAGWGFGNTFRTNIPLWRIDYVFTNKASEVSSCYVPAAVASNHRPVIADIVLHSQSSPQVTSRAVGK